MRHKVRKLFTFLLFALYLLFLQNSVFNTHVHVLKDGTVERHAHPFSHSPDGKHQHSQQDFKLLHASGLNFLDTADRFELAGNLPVVEYLCTGVTLISDDRNLLTVGLRGPPRA